MHAIEKSYKIFTMDLAGHIIYLSLPDFHGELKFLRLPFTKPEQYALWNSIDTKNLSYCMVKQWPFLLFYIQV